MSADMTAKLRLGLGHRFTLDGATLTHNGRSYSVRGAHAEITSSGFALTKRIHLVITGDGWAVTPRTDSITVGRATAFAAQVNAAAQAAETGNERP